MDEKNIGNYIKKLRKEKKLSQQELADLMFVDRTRLSRWENGKSLPTIDNMKIICNIFNITLDELVSQEKTTSKNVEKHRNNLFDFLIKQEGKYKKIKKLFIIVLILLLLSITSFLIYYFYQTYNSQKVYNIYTKSDNYKIDSGMVVVTKDTSYFKIGTINNQIYNISLYYKKGNKDIILFEGSSNALIARLYYIDSPINNKKFNEVIDNLYIKINEEEIKLYFNLFYKNDTLIFKEWADKYNIENVNEIIENETIPTKIKEEFNCDEKSCNIEFDNTSIFYIIADNTLYLLDDYANVQYNITINLFDFESDDIIFSIKDDELICYTKNCDNYEKMYEKYFTNILKPYIN